MDKFAQIAKDGVGGRLDQLVKPEPQTFAPHTVTLTAGPFVPLVAPERLDTAEKLRSALDAMRAQYAPFLRSVAPSKPATRTTLPLQTFTWRRTDIPGEAQIVTLPHYGGPLGAASVVYEADFQCTLPEGKRAFLVITGADYKARAFVNGTFVGMHEGFFATFRLDITKVLHAGTNALRIELDNDYAMLGSSDEMSNDRLFGDKLFAATGPGYDDPLHGWHHCPPGMGLFDKVFIEICNPVFVSDVFARTLDEEVEIWAEVTSCDYAMQKVQICASLYGENHEQTVFEDRPIQLSTTKAIGLGDTFTEVIARREHTLGASLPLQCAKGRNLFKFRIPREGLRLWQLDSPYLYRISLSVFAADGNLFDTSFGVFGVRTFMQDVQGSPKGMFSLNGADIRLRGANTMGFEQQDVMRGDTSQLIDDMLLAKLCNMNFLRLTQRPVQSEVYDICDRVGLMTQTDLPLFGCLRRHQFCEAVRQAEEMERHVRRHACNVVVTYINEPFPNAQNQPNMNLTRPELEQFFEAADIVVRLHNPDRVIKHVDGDYDPPDCTMPDNHCYPMWYNGHGIDIGRLHRGYWMHVKPDWYYGCGEFGCEGLEDEYTMRKGYPSSWLPQPGEEAAWRPSRIIGAQTDNFFHFFYEEQHSLQSWIAESQKFQAFATRMMTEAFRRNAQMVSFAIHLFIDAFPSGWMKTIMDCNRRPKPAFFAYREALSPILLSLRTDRFAYFAGEEMRVECWLCNDTAKATCGNIVYELSCGETPIATATQCNASIAATNAAYAATVSFVLPNSSSRMTYTLCALLINEEGNVLSQNEIAFDVHPVVKNAQRSTFLYKTIDAITDDDLRAVHDGAILFIDKPAAGSYTVAGTTVTVKESGMSPFHFAARDTGHAWANGFTPYDFRYWYSPSDDRIVPLAECTFAADGFLPVLRSRNLGENGDWQPEMLLGEHPYGNGRIVLSMISHQLLQANPAGATLLSRAQDDRRP